jgi:hypothetical protein
MCAIETRMPSEAPAKAAAAHGIAVSAIPATALPESFREAGYRLKTGRFLNRRATLDVGLEGVAVI